MAEVDYGYGDQLDYGYGDVEPDMMGEEKAVPFYSGPDADMYGYGNENDAAMSNGSPMDSEPSMIKRPKRRCSVTKFTLESGAPSTLTAASVIADMRNAGGVSDYSAEVIPVENVEALDAAVEEALDEAVVDGEPERGVTKKRSSMLRMFGMKRN